MTKLIWIAFGGAAGALARYGVSGLGYRLFGTSFPWGTLLVNASGCLVIGSLWAVSERVVLPARFSPLVLVGFLGAFTTFSTYGLETFNLLRDGEWGLGLLNLVLSNVLGLLLIALGFAGTRFLLAQLTIGEVP